PGTEKPSEGQKPSRFYKCTKEDAKWVGNAPVTLTLPPNKVSDKAVITGGAGYLGFTLGCALAKSGTKSDVRNFSDLYSACEGVDCLIHTASYGMTGIEQRQRIPRLIYTSTVNVVFAGQMIQVNEYSRTKAIAEQMVLAANGSFLPGTSLLVLPFISFPATCTGGQAYFINDGEEVNLFEWLSPLLLSWKKYKICCSPSWKSHP
ncbi:hypothetical protein E2320_012160, partial [Naja naja]